ncbi:hypothetical protein J3R30DRAFT_2115188 [Lentinula aciculospora]|uniref:Zn(2)-C6 fungal-type domain-containing protein n=1 Tax=Lentinula aciculospora TaxID=153920 RepID=A0A9W9DRP0_9AGAR|nr:hypothetical protein J3R30DRAFT_2115188 [Lentinula aciculospora]
MYLRNSDFEIISGRGFLQHSSFVAFIWVTLKPRLTATNVRCDFTSIITMDRDEYIFCHRPAKPEKTTCPPFWRPYAWHLSDASDFSSHSEPSSDPEPPQEKVVRNKDHRACDRCRELRYRCKKVTGEECSLCAKCASSGKECTYLRPVGRPGPTRGAFKRIPTLRNTPFSKRRALSSDDFKDLSNRSRLQTVTVQAKDPTPIGTDTRDIQPSVKLTELHSGDEPKSDSCKIHSCSQEEASGSLGRILNSSRSYPLPSGSKSLPMRTDVQHNPKKLTGDVQKSHRPLMWVQTRELLDSTTVRNKKHLFAD